MPMPIYQRPIIYILVGVLIVGIPAPGFAQQGQTDERQDEAKQSPPAAQSGQEVVRVTTQLV